MKAILRPLLVPWMISPSCSYFTLSATEEDWLCSVDAGVSFCPLEPPGTHPEHARVRISFECGVAAKLIARDGDDWPFAEIATHFEPPPESPHQEFADVWMATKHCPDPGAYEVVGSRWVTDIGRCLRPLKHFVFLGKEGYVEVLAADWRWELLGRSSD